MPAYNADLDRFAGIHAQVVGVSVDSVFSHIAWQKRDVGLLNYPLASDFYPHGDVARKYKVFREGPPIPGINDRMVYVVDKQGKIAMAQLYDLGQQPDNADVFEVLQKLQ